jgi:heme exporter protein D
MKNRLSIFIFLLPLLCYGQKEDAPKGKRYPAVIYKGDTIPYIVLNTVVISSGRTFKSPKDEKKWYRLLYNVKKVYPYAILAAARLKEYDRLLTEIPNEAERNRRMKQAEKDLKAEFGEELKNLTITQGRILIKLIDRETGKTSYDIVKDMRGSFSAFMWQGVAVMFNSSMKNEYEPNEEDKDIERAIKIIENGYY